MHRLSSSSAVCTGSPCLVFDIIVNPGVIKDARADKTGGFRHFVCDLALQYVEKKVREPMQLSHTTVHWTFPPIASDAQYGIPVSRQYKLPKLKYKGEKVRTQFLRKRKGPVIQEVSNPNEVRPAAAKVEVQPATPTQIVLNPRPTAFPMPN